MPYIKYLYACKEPDYESFYRLVEQEPSLASMALISCLKMAERIRSKKEDDANRK